MARPCRIVYAGALYHVMARGNNGRPLFRTDHDQYCWYETLKQYGTLYHVLIHAHVEMKNHFHLLLETPFANLSEFMRDSQRQYVLQFKRRHKHRGYLFQDRYKSIVVEKEQYYLSLLHYIHANPLRAGLVNSLEEYRWSSYGEYLGKYNSTLPLAWDEMRSRFPGNFTNQFISFHQKKSEYPQENRIRGIAYYGRVEFGEKINIERRRFGRQQLKRITIQRLEEAINKATNKKISEVITGSKHSDTTWKRRIILLARELCGLNYQELGRHWQVKPTMLAKHYSRYIQGISEPEQEILDRLRLSISS